MPVTEYIYAIFKKVYNIHIHLHICCFFFFMPAIQLMSPSRATSYSVTRYIAAQFEHFYYVLEFIFLQEHAFFCASALWGLPSRHYVFRFCRAKREIFLFLFVCFSCRDEMSYSLFLPFFYYRLYFIFPPWAYRLLPHVKRFWEMTLFFAHAATCFYPPPLYATFFTARCSCAFETVLRDARRECLFPVGVAFRHWEIYDIIFFLLASARRARHIIFNSLWDDSEVAESLFPPPALYCLMLLRDIDNDKTYWEHILVIILILLYYYYFLSHHHELFHFPVIYFSYIIFMFPFRPSLLSTPCSYIIFFFFFISCLFINIYMPVRIHIYSHIIHYYSLFAFHILYHPELHIILILLYYIFLFVVHLLLLCHYYYFFSPPSVLPLFVSSSYIKAFPVYYIILFSHAIMLCRLFMLFFHYIMKRNTYCTHYAGFSFQKVCFCHYTYMRLILLLSAYYIYIYWLFFFSYSSTL